MPCFPVDVGTFNAEVDRGVGREIVFDQIGLIALLRRSGGARRKDYTQAIHCWRSKTPAFARGRYSSSRSMRSVAALSKRLTCHLRTTWARIGLRDCRERPMVQFRQRTWACSLRFYDQSARDLDANWRVSLRTGSSGRDDSLVGATSGCLGTRVPREVAATDTLV